ncbi:arginine--tRNA ligase [Stratiformator vulcanicus]|uniref:Arginine--tRNA ligase n=1 Tax=Stratiformator vulcanicus TaxID=2527980 RepID=A0A517QZF0_9PLAN|nr:arginine--tRNA ligase [Stratiformator vulcanicus]QDT37019.1 Arginine--tRNA ligase [Stratiformator vulcanicus]
MDFLAALKPRFEAALAPLVDDPTAYLEMIRTSQDPKFGDFQANMAMPLKGKLGKKPREIAADIVANLDVSDLCEPPEIAGPGFINLKITPGRLRDETMTLVSDERLGVAKATSPRKVVVDFSAPNVAKPMHVGHLRSSVIGDAIRRTLLFLGHDVTGDNHIGDWGTQFGMIIYGYKNFLDQSAFEADPVAELARLYRLVNRLSDYHATKASLAALAEKVEVAKTQLSAAEAEAEADPTNKKSKKQLAKLKGVASDASDILQMTEASVADLESDPALLALANEHPDIARNARDETVKLHAGDAENAELWQRFLPACLEAIDRVYQRLGVKFDETLGESFYQPMLSEVVSDLEAKGLASESDGATVVFTEGHKAPFIIRKRDGAFLYATTDLATIKYRVDQWHADSILYVVDKRQSQHFEQLFDTARRWGYDGVEYRHVSFGTVLGDDKKPFKTRSGDTVGLESLLDEAVTRARAIINENDNAKPDGAELNEEQRDHIAEIVGIGGIKYADLKHNRESDYVFSWDKMLATNGDTATYMQYAYARVCGILRRGGVDREQLRTESSSLDLKEPAERTLALQLNRFAEAVAAVERDYRPNILTDYLFETASRFSSFYDQCPVLKAETEEQRRSRLLLCDLTARVIKQGLDLLGIETSERM